MANIKIQSNVNEFIVCSLLLLEYQTVRLYENGKIDRVLATNIKVDEDSGHFLRKRLPCERKGMILILSNNLSALISFMAPDNTLGNK